MVTIFLVSKLCINKLFEVKIAHFWQKCVSLQRFLKKTLLFMVKFTHYYI
jgi:hypothetical protein